MFGVIFKIILR
jgi:hypothetical protein